MNKYESILETLGFDIEKLPEDPKDLESILNTLDIRGKLQIYLNLDLYFRSLDVEDYIEENEIEDINFDESDYTQIAQDLIDNYDCNLSFNNQLEHFVTEYVNSKNK